MQISFEVTEALLRLAFTRALEFYDFEVGEDPNDKKEYIAMTMLGLILNFEHPNSFLKLDFIREASKPILEWLEPINMTLVTDVQWTWGDSSGSKKKINYN